MGIPFPSFSCLFALLLFLLVAAKALASMARNPTPRLPPGPPKLPILGNLHQLLGALPHRTLRDLARKYGPLMHLQLGEISTVVVSSPEAAMEALKNHEIHFADRPRLPGADIVTYGYTDIAFSPYNDYWRQMRKICQFQLLSVKRVQSFRSIREAEVSNFIQSISAIAKTSSLFDFSREIFSFNYGITARVAFGKKSNDQEAYISFIREVFPYMDGFNVVDLYPSFKLFSYMSRVMSKIPKLHQTRNEILENIVLEHRVKAVGINEESQEDLVDVLLKLQQQDEGLKLSDDNIKATIHDIFSAGSDTVATTVEWAMSEMMKNPHIMKSAQAEVRHVFEGKRNADETKLHELKYLKSVIKETLRLHPAAPLLLPRECRESCEISGYEIPLKTRLVVNAWAIGRDPNHWSDAESFEPKRFLDSLVDYKGGSFEFIPFGVGRRMCPGIVFAMAGMELLLAQLLFHFDWRLPDGTKPEELDMSESFGIVMNRKKALRLIPIPYQHIYE